MVRVGADNATGLLDVLAGSLHATTLSLASGTLDFNDETLAIRPDRHRLREHVESVRRFSNG